MGYIQGIVCLTKRQLPKQFRAVSLAEELIRTALPVPTMVMVTLFVIGDGVNGGFHGQFPDYINYTELGVIAGTGLSPVYNFDYNPLFNSGFE